MKQGSVGYEIIRFYVRIAFWLTHKKVLVTGRENIPHGKPVIFAPNHQNALMDPLALVCTNRHQTVWLARADIFKRKPVQAILKYLKLLPIYRIRDGKENLTNNEQIFARVIQLLEQKQTIGLFPEAAHSGRRQMLPHKKAVPRIALEAEAANNFELDLQIVPVGIYYDHYWFLNRTLIVRYGEPIATGQFRDEYAENLQKALLSLRDMIHDRLLPLVLEIGSKEHYPFYENIRQLAGKAHSKRFFFSKNAVLQSFFSDQEFIKKLEKLESEQPEVFEQLREKTGEYFEALSAEEIDDKQIRMVGETGIPKMIIRGMLAVLSLPLFIIGFAFNALPFYLPRIIIRRKVKDTAFLSTFNFAAGLIIFPVFYLIEACLLFHFTGNLYLSILAFFILPLAGKISYQLLLFYQEIGSGLTAYTGTKTFRNKLKNLSNRRNEFNELVLRKIKDTEFL